MTPAILNKRLKDWAIQMIFFCRKMPEAPEFKAIRYQLVRSAPSVAANYRAACRRRSARDFLNKLKIVEEELDESMFWMEFTVALDPAQRSNVVPLYKEANELLSIIVASISTLRKHQ